MLVNVEAQNSAGPVMQVPDLWSDSDRMAVTGFEVAVRHGDLAGALLALDGVTAQEAAAHRQTISDFALRVRTELLSRDPVTSLSVVLVDEAGFCGDPEDYFAPANSRLSDVLTRRRGMPILLSAVWMLVGEQAGIVVEGIGLPGHFIVRVGGSTGVLADPFNGGRMLSVGECRQLVGKLSGGAVQWNDAFLHPIPMDGLLERVLRNLAHIWQRLEVPEQMLRTARFYAALRPREAEPRLVQAKIADAFGATDLAEMLYRAVVDGFPSSAAAETAASRLQELRGAAVDIN